MAFSTTYINFCLKLKQPTNRFWSGTVKIYGMLTPSDWSLMSDRRSILLREKPVALKVGRPLAPKAGLLSLLAWRPGSENLCP